MVHLEKIRHFPDIALHKIEPTITVIDVCLPWSPRLTPSGASAGAVCAATWTQLILLISRSKYKYYTRAGNE